MYKRSICNHSEYVLVQAEGVSSTPCGRTKSRGPQALAVAFLSSSSSAFSSTLENENGPSMKISAPPSPAPPMSSGKEINIIAKSKGSRLVSRQLTTIFPKQDRSHRPIGEHTTPSADEVAPADDVAVEERVRRVPVARRVLRA